MPQRYPQATMLFLEADSAGNHGAHSRVWKQHLQEKIADRFGLMVTVDLQSTLDSLDCKSSASRREVIFFRTRSDMQETVYDLIDELSRVK